MKRSIDIINTKKVESLEEDLAYILECVCSVVRESLTYEYVTIESCKSRDCSDSDTTE